MESKHLLLDSSLTLRSCEHAELPAEPLLSSAVLTASFSSSAFAHRGGISVQEKRSRLDAAEAEVKKQASLTHSPVKSAHWFKDRLEDMAFFQH